MGCSFSSPVQTHDEHRGRPFQAGGTPAPPDKRASTRPPQAAADAAAPPLLAVSVSAPPTDSSSVTSVDALLSVDSWSGYYDSDDPKAAALAGGSVGSSSGGSGGGLAQQGSFGLRGLFGGRSEGKDQEPQQQVQQQPQPPPLPLPLSQPLQHSQPPQQPPQPPQQQQRQRQRGAGADEPPCSGVARRGSAPPAPEPASDAAPGPCSAEAAGLMRFEAMSPLAAAHSAPVPLAAAPAARGAARHELPGLVPRAASASAAAPTARGALLRARRGGVSAGFARLQAQLPADADLLSVVSTRAAGLKHIGFGPLKNENQDEFFIQVGHFGGQPGGNAFCVFDGHGTYGGDAAAVARRVMPSLLDGELRKFFGRNPGVCAPDSAPATRGGVELILADVFGETERGLARAGVNLTSSGTTATAVLQLGNRIWAAAAGDSRAILCRRARAGGDGDGSGDGERHGGPEPGSADDGSGSSAASPRWRAQPLTLDHRPRRPSERERVETAGARVQPKRLASGRLVGEPRVWLDPPAAGPGLLLSRSLGDLLSSTVGCTSDPEITYATLRPWEDRFFVVASDGVWDVLTNDQVCDIVTDAPDPHEACRRVLDAALYEWEELGAADNISVVVVELDWGCVVRDADGAAAFARAALRPAFDPAQSWPAAAPAAAAAAAAAAAEAAALELQGGEEEEEGDSEDGEDAPCPAGRLPPPIAGAAPAPAPATPGLPPLPPGPLPAAGLPRRQVAARPPPRRLSLDVERPLPSICESTSSFSDDL
ncbi:agc pkg kinase [Raphidocelis subcapitata]|uniref:Agc pkg kinase n=1 Tax=Raphidocelis subcapitata TaxID=307507 RepID=A0A2V0PAB8_9CHLO|nr:agc pkg kinase [Raphidocelis subcapitata]|eukprot:GBF94055.1 agc pkg kinase [Raphidocelis subcapitata]